MATILIRDVMHIGMLDTSWCASSNHRVLTAGISGRLTKRLTSSLPEWRRWDIISNPE
jgi:hypothetical protein